MYPRTPVLVVEIDPEPLWVPSGALEGVDDVLDILVKMVMRT